MKIYKNEDTTVIILPFENFNGREVEDFNGHRALMEKFVIIKTIFKNSNFRNAVLKNNNIETAIFQNNNLIMSEFENSTIIDTKFIDCDMSFSNFRNVDFRNVHFENCNMKHVDFSDGILFDVLFDKNMDIETIILENVYYNDKTVFPEGFDLKNKKMNFVDNCVKEKYIQLEKEFNTSNDLFTKHPLRELDIMIEKYKTILEKKDLESLIYHLILCNLVLKYKVSFKSIIENTEKLLLNKEIIEKESKYTKREFEEINKLIREYRLEQESSKLY